MAQSYFSAPQKPVVTPDTPGHSLTRPLDKVAKAEDVQEAYQQQRDCLVDAIDNAQSILSDLRKFNKQSWIVRYPYLAPAQLSAAEEKPTHHVRRSLSFADDPVSSTDVLLTPHKKRSIRRSLTLASIPDTANDESASSTEVSDPDAETLIDPSTASDFHVLRLDLRLGSSNSAALVTQLEKSSIANLLDDRIGSSMVHMSKLRTRVLDTSSKVLVTGDLNAGKSTFVNALLHRDIMPMDQQPCTTMFCEVHDKAENDGKEEAHIVKDGLGVTYDRLDESTYTRVTIENLDGLLADQDPFSESQRQGVLKLYLSDTRRQGESLLTNGLVSISLIDAPGLNRDSFKTTSLFSRQEEIDVIVFVVSAENHFTLSAKEFLWNASNEKAYVFVVVNRFDMIRDKEKCKRIVLEQIKQFSPATWEDRDDLVHFVDSASALAHGLLHAQQRQESKNAIAPNDQSASQQAFQALESSLRTFVLSKRFKSKLLPARTYITHLLSDVDLLAQSNAIVAEGEAERSRGELEAKRPVLERMMKGKEGLEDGLERVEETVVKNVKHSAKERLESALDKVGKGEIGITSKDLATLPRGVTMAPPSLPPYPGLFGIWDYARDVRRALLASLDLAVKMAEEGARAATVDGVDQVNALEDKYLPLPTSVTTETPTGVRTRRIFMPQAMFVPRITSDKGKKRSSRHRQSASPPTIVAGGSQGLGLGLLTQRSDLMQVTFVDILDLNHHLMTRLYPRHGKKDDQSDDDDDDDDDASASALGTLGLGLGAITMVGGRTIGARGLIEGVIRVSDLLFGPSGASGRWWVAPLVGAATLGFTIYFVLELPREIPRTVGRRIRSALNHPDKFNATASLARASLTTAATGGAITGATASVEPRFADAHADRISRETRKVLRLAAWDLRERFRAAMEESVRDVRSAEEMEKRALDAIKWFTQVGKRTESVMGSIVG